MANAGDGRAGSTRTPTTRAGTWTAALLAAGATVELAHARADGELDNGFALRAPARPPRHGRDQAMGFCLLNNVAVAAARAAKRAARAGGDLDWDVHHGNGTEDDLLTRTRTCSTSPRTSGR